MRRPLSLLLLRWLLPLETGPRSIPVRNRDTGDRGALWPEPDECGYGVSFRDEAQRPERVRDRLRQEQWEASPRRQVGDRPRFHAFAKAGKRK